ncbi:MAG: glutamate-1-semialdehyde 2,1-aminomutase [Pseudomonadota bacterium]|nr:glutamate-1-semialdehyde 2,1-aminomutase [Pseudomonadota bacterium]
MNNSKKAFVKAKNLFPGGVNSPVRAFKNVNSEPFFVKRAKGPYLYDVDNKKYIDFIGSWGPMILGHANKEILKAISISLKNGTSYGAPTLIESKMAELIKKNFPSIEKMRMTSSGTEATMSAIRLARGFSKRELIIKFEGCYHGHSDSLLSEAGSGLSTFGNPSSPGIPKGLEKLTINLRYNDIKQLENCFKKYSNKIACVIIEPIAGNMNMILPNLHFLKKIRTLCNKNKSILIFDEVMTGFRVSIGGAQKLYGVKPDLTTLGKIVGGGLPVGVFGGKKQIMDSLSPVGPIYHAGTLSGNPIAMSAGIKTIELLNKKNIHKKLENKCQHLLEGMSFYAKKNNIPFKYNYAGGMFGYFFTNFNEVTNYDEVKKCNKKTFIKFFNMMLSKGVYFAPSMFEAGFISYEHSEKDINKVINASKSIFKNL